jgi:hypothetical protein
MSFANQKWEVMNIKRLFILFILILFVTVSCAGPNKAGWRKSHFRQDEFEKDRNECMQTLSKNSYSQTSGLLADCLAWKGYEYTGPSQVRWTKPDFSQDQFEKDRKDCVQAAQDGLEQKLTVEECLAKKGYESEPQPSSDQENSKVAEIAKAAENSGGSFLVVVYYAAMVAALILLLL